jgi:hypothetical protein
MFLYPYVKMVIIVEKTFFGEQIKSVFLVEEIN